MPLPLNTCDPTCSPVVSRGMAGGSSAGTPATQTAGSLGGEAAEGSRGEPDHQKVAAAAADGWKGASMEDGPDGSRSSLEAVEAPPSKGVGGYPLTPSERTSDISSIQGREVIESRLCGDGMGMGDGGGGVAMCQRHHTLGFTDLNVHLVPFTDLMVRPDPFTDLT